MRITIKQLRSLIREAVEDASNHDEQFDQQFYDPKLGLKNVTTSREAANGTISLLDPETNEKYKITVPTRYLRVLRDPEKVQTSRHAIGLGMGNYNPARVLVSPKDVADDIEFIKVVRATITKYVTMHRKKQKLRLKETLFAELNDAVNNGAMEDESFHTISNIATMRKFVELDFMQYLESKYSDDEIMTMYAEWEQIRK